MRILADKNIPFVNQAFSNLGDVRTISGREITRDAIGKAELLLVRSVTPVNESLLGGTNVKFVASATIGTDHVDEEYLLGAGIGFTSAPGCNSNSVAEYVTAALLCWAERRQLELAALTLGVVGVGHVGSKVIEKATALGMSVLCNDPPRQRAEGLDNFLDLDLLLEDCDALTFHVPLTRTGEDATLDLIDADLLDRLGDRVLLINTSRGPVHCTSDLLADRQARRDADRPPVDLVLDVWENEPAIDLALLDETLLATPHIAGYSFDGKLTGTMMVYQAACAFFGQAPVWQFPDELPGPRHELIEVESSGLTDQEIARLVVRHAYDIEWDDTSLREIADREPEQQGAYFDGLRADYPVRREFPAGKVRLADPHPTAAQILSRLGFDVVG
jgi:erythronate-4-phosphate dehydrogenase